MDAPCPACAAGPFAIAGHGKLRVQRIGDGHLAFQCLGCGALWDRAGNPGAGFRWARIGDRAAMSPAMGIAVPPRSSSFHPFGDLAGRTARP